MAIVNREQQAGSPAAAGVRRILLLALAVGIVGIAVELVLVDHLEDWKQWIPLVALVAAGGMIVWSLLHCAPIAVRAVQFSMLCLIAVGLVGVVLHLRGSAEFQAEIDSSLSRWELLGKAFRATAPPALAPGSLIQLGLVGLAYAFGHPNLKRARQE